MKRLIDIVVGSVALVLLFPFMLLIAMLVFFSIGLPVIFCQVRPGLHGKLFTLYKFRTMRDSHDAEGKPCTDGQRLTQISRFLRSASLDELPELWNVVRGEMSLVGPRPLLIDYLPLFNSEQARRHEVKPGITGWAQINGRNSITWEERFELDVWYVDHQSAWLDFKILLLTVWKVLLRDGISAEGEATMGKFKGTV